MNFVILGAVLIQGLISKKNQVVGAVFGLLITIGIAIWGIGLYNDGDAIAFFGLELSAGVFYLFVGAWAIYDIVMIFHAANGKMQIRLAKETNIYQTTDANSEIVNVKNRGHVIEVSRNVKNVNGTEWMKVFSSDGEEEGYILGTTPILRKFTTQQKETLIYARADASSDVLENVARGGEIQLGESLVVGGVTWVEASTNKTMAGYINGNTKGSVINE